MKKFAYVALVMYLLFELTPCAAGEPLGYGAGIQESFRTRKPLVVYVNGATRGDACKVIDAIVCDTSTSFGSAKPRLILLTHSGTVLRVVGEWEKPPTADEIRRAMATSIAPVVAPVPMSVTVPAMYSPAIPTRQLNLTWSGRFTTGTICVGVG